jgi:hypothetical protein
MSVEHTRSVMERYWDLDDPTAIAPDAAYVFMPTGERFVGPDAILAMMRDFYGATFAMTPTDVTRHVGDGWAMLESTLVGTHVGPYAGIPATGRPVRAPMCVTYRVAHDQVVEVRAYLMLHRILEQIRD